MKLATTAEPPPRRRFYDVTQAAELLGVSRPLLYRLIRAGEFPAIKLRGRYVIPARAIDELESSAIAAGLVDPAEATPQPERGWQR